MVVKKKNTCLGFSLVCPKLYCKQNMYWNQEWIRLEHWWDDWLHMFSRALHNIQGSQQPLVFNQTIEKTLYIPEVLLLSSGIGYLFKSTAMCFLVWTQSFLLTNMSFLVSNTFCLGVGLCYLLLFVSALNTYVSWRFQSTPWQHWCLRLIFLLFTVSSKPRCRGM